VPVRLRALVLLVCVLDLPVLHRLVLWLTREPPVDTVEVDGVVLELVRPGGTGPWPTWVFMNGAHPERRQEPVVRRLTEGLARAGFLVVVPDPPGLADEEVTTATLEGAVAATRAAVGLRDVRDGRVALLGASTGASLALLVAADPQVRGHVSIVASAVPFGNLRKVICLATTSSYEDESGAATYPVGELLRRVVSRSLAVVVPPEAAPALDDLLGNEDPARFPALYDGLPADVRATVERLSPVRVAGEVAAPVEIVVPPLDEYFPLGEARSLAGALPNARLTVTGTLDHTRPASKLRSLPPFWRFVVRGLAGSL
jgi:pimeloyl-ACP methyl ester carboxylesterase